VRRRDHGIVAIMRRMVKKLTIKEIFELKGKRQLTEVYVSDAREAAAAEAAGLDMIVTADGNDIPAFRAAAPNAFFTVGMTYGKASSADELIRNAFSELRRGADAVYAGGVSMAWVEALAKQNIGVVGHVGLIPYIATWTGGFKAVGKTADEALKLYQRTKDYENAGAIAIELECVPDRVAAEITKRTRLCVLSMGSGNQCDGQYLFSTDILGTNTGHVPRHAKVYRDFKAEYARLQQEAIAAYGEFKADVDNGGYPAPQHTIPVKDDEFKRFLKALKNA
jgi:3-methyl-2-oxobutanoate hydroxymethyltransferase